jgi:hypothetical protein
MLLAGCGAKAPRAVITETNLGEAVVMTEAPRVASREDVPAGVKPSEVIAVVKTPEGGKLWLVKKKKRAGMPAPTTVFRNEQAQAQGLAAEQMKPSRTWIWVLVGLAVCAGCGFLVREKIKGPLTAAWAIIMRVFRR